MRRISRYRSDKLPQYLLTHPNPEVRLDYVQSLMKMDEQELAAFTERDEFNFLRFKYRVMAESSDANSFREYLSSVVSDSQAAPLRKTMAKYGLSQLERVTNNARRGLELLEEVIAALPDKSILLSDKGVMLYSLGDYANARVILEKAGRADGKDMYAAFYLGKTWQMLGEPARAEAQFTAVSYNLPEYSKAYFELGKIASEKKKSAAASLLLGKYYLLEGKLESARFSLETVARDKTASEKEKEESETMLETIDRLEDD
jgi:predicted Zn-dependent protease